MSRGPFIAVDWGTTNRRAYRIEAGTVVAQEGDGRGVTAIAADGWAAEVAGLRDRLGDLPMLLAGMVGSTIGWHQAPYVPAPAGIEDLARHWLAVDDRTVIVPGLSVVADGRGDVMRGEEVQLFGAVAAGLAPADALLCQPGTHCKWADLRDGRVTGFTTAMTGELFALLRGHGILAAQLAGAVVAGDAFAAGVEAGRRGDLLGALFGIRAGKLLGLRDDGDAASYASGLLIGADVAARVGPGDTVHVLADATLGALYAMAIRACGGVAVAVDSQAAFVAGITRLGQFLP